MNDEVLPREIWYRYDYTTDPEGRVSIWLQEYRVIKKTPKGVRLDIFDGGKGKFVLLNSSKRYACPTKKEAEISFIRRKEKQLRILSAQIKSVELALALIKEGKAKGTCSVQSISWNGE